MSLLFWWKIYMMCDPLGNAYMYMHGLRQPLEPYKEHACALRDTLSIPNCRHFGVESFLCLIVLMFFIYQSFVIFSIFSGGGSSPLPLYLKKIFSNSSNHDVMHLHFR